jgi:hypothetical protein
MHRSYAAKMVRVGRVWRHAVVGVYGKVRGGGQARTQINRQVAHVHPSLVNRPCSSRSRGGEDPCDE